MKLPLLVFILLIVFGGLVFAQAAFESPEAKAQSVAEKTAQSLGWPTSTAPREGISGSSYTVTPNGGYEDDPQIFAFVAVMPSDSDAKNVIQTLADNGLTRGSFHGREAIKEAVRRKRKVSKESVSPTNEARIEMGERKRKMMLVKIIAIKAGMRTTFPNAPRKVTLPK